MVVTGTQQRVYGTLVASGGVACWKYEYNTTIAYTTGDIESVLSDDGTTIFGINNNDYNIFAIHTTQPPNKKDASILWISPYLSGKIYGIAYKSNTSLGDVICVSYVGASSAVSGITLLNANTGQIIWKITGFVSSYLTIDNDIIYVQSSNTIRAHYVSDGSLKWVTGSNYDTGMPCIYGDYLYGVYGISGLTTFRKISKETGTVTSSSVIYNVYINSTYKTKVVYDNVLYIIITYRSVTYCIDTTDFSIQWSTSDYSRCLGYNQFGQTDPINPYIYLSTDSYPASVICMNAITGEQIWQYIFPNGDTTTCDTSVALYNNTLYVGYFYDYTSTHTSRDSGIIAINKDTGTKLWETPIGINTDGSNPNVSVGIIVANETTVFVYGFDNSPYSYALYGVANKCSTYSPIYAPITIVAPTGTLTNYFVTYNTGYSSVTIYWNSNLLANVNTPGSTSPITSTTDYAINDGLIEYDYGVNGYGDHTFHNWVVPSWIYSISNADFDVEYKIIDEYIHFWAKVHFHAQYTSENYGDDYYSEIIHTQFLISENSGGIL